MSRLIGYLQRVDQPKELKKAGFSNSVPAKAPIRDHANQIPDREITFIRCS